MAIRFQHCNTGAVAGSLCYPHQEPSGRSRVLERLDRSCITRQSCAAIGDPHLDDLERARMARLVSGRTHTLFQVALRLDGIEEHEVVQSPA